MPKIVIDNLEVEVPAGTNVLEAAKKLGIVIPHFCYHQALGAVGACRLCAMKFVEGPVKGIQMSCMIPAQDGMVVSTVDGEAQRMRELVIEWLMINHPHDCPVCDEGGECLLQDYTIAGGHGLRRYKGKKRTFLNQYLGPYIEHEMNRCIECYRCSRFYQEYAGGTDLGPMGSAGRVYFGRFEEGSLESPYSGNLVDICPTGVYTDKTARYRGRYWDYDMAPSVCPGCGLGCGIIPVARFRELLKIVARRNDAVNGFFICDRGRFDKSVNDPHRPRTPLVDGRETGWDEALDAVAARLLDVVREHGPEAVAVIGSPRMSLEGNLAVAALASHLGVAPCFFATAGEAERAEAVVAALTPEIAVSLKELQSTALVIIYESDMMEEGPMAALAIRQAWRRGTKVVASRSPVERLPFPVEEIDHVAEICGAAGCATQVIVCGTATNTATTIAGVAKMGTKVLYLLPAANSFGAALLSREHKAVSLEERAASGKLRAVVSFEADLPPEIAATVPVLAVADWTATVAVRSAEARSPAVVLPVAAFTESDGTWISAEGRAQRSMRVMRPGIPVAETLRTKMPEADPERAARVIMRQVDARDELGRELPPVFHPPRDFRSSPPGGDPLPAWRVISELLRRFGGEPIVEPLTGKWETLRNLDPEGEGVRVLADTEGSR
jgi:NADH-quinone oxidoreductase subunit G